jgi:hypothetical protein
MNPRCPRAPSQAHLQFDHQNIWQRLPVSDRTLCRDLLVQILIEVIRSERSNEDERQD